MSIIPVVPEKQKVLGLLHAHIAAVARAAEYISRAAGIFCDPTLEDDDWFPLCNDVRMIEQASTVIADCLNDLASLRKTSKNLAAEPQAGAVRTGRPAEIFCRETFGITEAQAWRVIGYGSAKSSYINPTYLRRR